MAPGYRNHARRANRPAPGPHSLAAIVQYLFQVVPAIDECKLERRDPAEIVGHRVSRDEKRLVSRAELIG